MDSPDSDQPYILPGTRKRGRPAEIGYDVAYQNMLDSSMDMREAFTRYAADYNMNEADRYQWNNFRRAMNRKKKNGET